MDLTGERIIPRLVDPDLLAEHVARYRFAEQFVAGKRVLDVACGVGYGSEMLAATASRVTASDLSTEALAFAREHHAAANVDFVTADCTALPFSAGTFDVVVGFEIVEHIENQSTFLAECRRVVRSRGVVILSTPNREVAEELHQINPFHVRELSFEEFSSAISDQFPFAEYFGQNHTPAVSVARKGAPESGYFIAVCGPSEAPTPRDLLLPIEGGMILREREKHIRILLDDIARLKGIIQHLKSDLEEKARWTSAMSEQISGRDRRIVELEAEISEKSRWAASLSEEAARRDTKLLELQKEFDDRAAWAVELETMLAGRDAKLLELQKEFDDRTAWAVELETMLAGRDAKLLELQKEFDDRTRWALDLRKMVDEYESQIGDLRAQVGSLDGQIQDYEGRVRSLDRQLHEIQSRFPYRVLRKIGLF